MLKWLKSLFCKKPMELVGDGYTVTWSASPLLKLPNVVEETRKRKPALKKATTRAVWPKDFDAKDVAKALDKQAPKRKKPMPLKKSTSKAAFKSNVKEEAKTKPIKQAVAIAYAVKKTAAKKATKK
jgi:hypothetical protein